MSGPMLGLADVPPTPAVPPRTLADLPARRAAPVAPPASATLIERIDLTDAIALFRVRDDEGPRPFVPGQYLSLGFQVGGATVQRTYSMASAPGSAYLKFLIRRVEGGTFTPALWTSPAGTRVRLGRAKGTFTLRPDDGRRPVFIATGTGLAPFVAMLRATGNDAARAEGAVVVHGVARVPELAYRTDLSAMADAGRIVYVPTVSRPDDPANAGWPGAVGRVTDTLAAAARDGVIDPARCVAYLCGNPAMIGSASAALIGFGVPPEAIVTERYWEASRA